MARQTSVPQLFEVFGAVLYLSSKCLTSHAAGLGLVPIGRIRRAFGLGGQRMRAGCAKFDVPWLGFLGRDLLQRR